MRHVIAENREREAAERNRAVMNRFWQPVHASIFGGGLVNCTAINKTDADDADTVFEDPSGIQEDGTGEQRIYLHFATPIPLAGLTALLLISNGTPTLSFDMDTPNNGGDLTGYSFGYSIGIVKTDWDPETLTQNNQPAATLVAEGGSMTLGFGDALDSTLDANDAEFDVTTSRFIGALLQNQTGTAFGFALGVTASTSGANLTNVKTSIGPTINANKISFPDGSFALFS